MMFFEAKLSPDFKTLSNTTFIFPYNYLDYVKIYIERNGKFLSRVIDTPIKIVPKEDSLELFIPKEAPTIEGLNDLSKFFKKDKANYEQFRGSFAFEWGWLMYLQRYYKNNLVCMER